VGFQVGGGQRLVIGASATGPLIKKIIIKLHIFFNLSKKKINKNYYF
jgi:hypothetical protein